MKDRRRHKRYKVGTKVVAALRTNHEDQVILLSTADISRGGLLLVGESSSFPLVTGMMTEITLHLVSEHTEEKIYFKAKVIEPRESNSFGMEIEDIDEHNRKLLNSYIEFLEEQDD